MTASRPSIHANEFVVAAADSLVSLIVDSSSAKAEKKDARATVPVSLIQDQVRLYSAFSASRSRNAVLKAARSMRLPPSL